MRIPVLVEPSQDGRFIARPKDPSPWRGTGTTKAEAVRDLQKVADEAIQKPIEEFFIEIDERTHPILRYAGTLSEEDYIALSECIAENRRRDEEGPTPELHLP